MIVTTTDGRRFAMRASFHSCDCDINFLTFNPNPLKLTPSKRNPLNNGMESRTRLEILFVSSYIGSVLRETAEERDRRLFLERKQKMNNGEAVRNITESMMRTL